MAFDPSQPFEVLDEEPRFDPTQPFTYEPAPGAERTALADRASLAQAAPSTTQGGTVGGGLTPASSQPGALDSLLATTGESLPSGRDIAAVVPTALRVGGPVVGAALAPFTGTASVPVGMGLAALGGLLAEPAAQAVERATGQREDFSAAEGAVNVAFAPLAAVGIPFANRALPTLGQRALQVGARGLEGAAISAGQGAAIRAARGEEQSLGATLTDAAVGGAFSAVLGTAFDELVRARRLDTAFTAARQAGFNGQSVDDLRGWWEAQRAARARNVTPEAGPAASPGANATNATAPRPAGAASPAPAPAAGPLATRAPRIDVEIVPAEAPVPRDVARLAGGLRAAELPAPAAPMALPTSARPALPAPSASVDPVTGSPALDNPSSDTPAPSGAATLPRALMPPAQPLRLAAPPPAQETVPPPPSAAAGAVGDQALETPGAAILPGAAEPARAPAAGKFAKSFEGKRDGELRQRAKILADTLTRPGTTPRRASTLREESAAIAAELAARKDARRAAGNTGRGFGIAPLPDGSPDLLNAIDDAGGIRGPREGETGGEYDGYAETFGAGLPRLLRNSNGQAVDKLVAELNEQGYRFQSSDDFYQAVTRAVQARERAVQNFERQIETDKFQQAALENRGRAKGEGAAKPVPVNDLEVGDTFKVKREPFEVMAVDERTGDAIVRDGPRFGTQVLPGGSQLYTDKRSLRRVPRTEVDQWPDLDPAQRDALAAAVREADEAYVNSPEALGLVAPQWAPAFDPAQPFEMLPAAPAPSPALRAPVGRTADMFDTGLADEPFTLAGQSTTDATGFMDEQARAAADRAAAEAAQGGLFDAPTTIIPKPAAAAPAVTPDLPIGQGSTLIETPAAPTEPAPTESMGRITITDFGEKLEGARKDMWQRMRDTYTAGLPAADADISLAKHFPEPNYETALLAGADIDALAMVKALRDLVPTKPQVPYRLRRWAELVRSLHGIATEVAAGNFKLSADRMAALLANAGPIIAPQVRLYQALGYPAFTKAKGWAVEQGGRTFEFAGQRMNPPRTITMVLQDRRLHTDLSSTNADLEAGYAEAVAKLRTRLEAETTAPAAPKEVKFDLYSDRRTGEYFIGRKGSEGVIRIKAGFTSAKAARDYLQDSRAELETAWAELKKEPQLRRAANEPRVGPSRRTGDVTPASFSEAFGFRGVQFGNYVEGPRRQADLNEAFDALVDMAEALGVPPQALSLDGTLGMAFGARGGGGGYAAHYEPDKVVINLTKTSGPGSLAHEWFHAFDNYFARLDETGSTDVQALGSYATARNALPKNMRREVWDAFEGIRVALSSGSFAQRSRSLDSTRSKPYYGTTIEKAARAFEVYVTDRLAGREITNDYLANLYKGALAQVEDSKSAYPYPREMDGGIRAAFDRLFNVLQVKPTARGQAFGIAAPGSDAFVRLQRMYDPQSVLPDEMRRALRFGQQAEAAILGRAKSIQSDLRRALNQVAKTNPGAADATFAYLTGAQPLAALPPAVRFPAQQARALIDGLSDRAIREGVVTGDLANTFADNLGTYLRRSYRLFADPSYFPEQPVRDRAAAYIMANWDPKRTLTRREADTVIAQLLDRPGAAQFMLGGKVAGRDVSSLVRRKDLVPEIRALYGEITDPLEAFGQTVPRLASLIENHQAQQWIRLAGLRMGLFTTEPTPLNPRQLVSDSNRPHEVWRGIYTSPEVAAALEKQAGSNPSALNLRDLIFSTVKTFTTVAKVGKTVLNPDSYAPNIIGGLVSMAANGNFNILPGGRGLLLGAEELGALRATGVLPQNRAQLQADIEKLARLGLRGEGISAADLVQTWERSLLPKLTGKAGRIVMPWLRVYGSIDDLTKYMAWKSELGRLKRWQPGAPLDRLEREAAERVRATMPTYSEIPKWLREASQLGIAPSFVSFTYEVFRNTANSARIAMRDLREGARSGNRAQAADGARRIGALLAVLAASSGAGVALLSRRENGVTDEQDEAVRFFGPKWNANGMLLYNTPVEGGRAQVSNLSYLLPHALVFEAIEAGSRGETGEEQARRFFSAIGSQFLAADGGVFLGPAIEAYVGVSRETGRPVVNRESPTPGLDALGYVVDRSLTPLAIEKGKRMVAAAREETGPFGRVYSLSEEGWRLAGVRAQTLDFNQAAEFKARELARRWVDATALYGSMVGRNVPPADLEAAYARSEQARQKVFGDAYNYLRYGLVAGVPEDNLVKNLRTAAGIGAEEILGLLENRYVPGQRERRESGAALIDRVAKLPEEQRASELVRSITADPRLARSLQREVETLAKGITQTDRLVLALDVANGSRARWVANQLATGRVTPVEAGPWLSELRRKGIVTDAVRDQLQTGSWQQMGE